MQARLAQELCPCFGIHVEFGLLFLPSLTRPRNMDQNCDRKSSPAGARTRTDAPGIHPAAPHSVEPQDERLGRLEEPLEALLNFFFCYTVKLCKYFGCFIWLLNQEKAKITLGGRKLNTETHVPLRRHTRPGCCSFSASCFPSARCSQACRGPSKPRSTPAPCLASLHAASELLVVP